MFELTLCFHFLDETENKILHQIKKYQIKFLNTPCRIINGSQVY